MLIKRRPLKQKNLPSDLFAPLTAARKIRALMTDRGPLKPHFTGLPSSIHRSTDGRHTAICPEDKPDGP